MANKVKVSPGGYVNYGDVKIKKFNGRAHVQHCEKWVAELLGIPAEAVHKVLPIRRHEN